MELLYLHTFCEVARWGSFTRAAEELGYAQPTVTAQMQKLEQSYGAPLFERYGRGLRLTKAGEALLPYARELTRLYGESKEVVSNQTCGPIRIGTIDTLAAYFLPRYLQDFRKKFPDIELLLHTASEVELVRQIKDGYLDIGLIFDRQNTDVELVTHAVRQDELVVIMPHEHRLATSVSITTTDLSGEALVLTEESCTYRGMLLEALNEAGIPQRIACQFSNPEAIKQCVWCGMGIALLPSMAVERERKDRSLAIVPFHSDKPPFFVQLIYHKKKWLSSPMESLIQSISRSSHERGES